MPKSWGAAPAARHHRGTPHPDRRTPAGAGASGESGLISQNAGLLIVAVTLGGTAILSVRSYKQYDELTRQISLDASKLTLHLTMIFIGGWAALSHHAYANLVRPLAYISLLALLQLIAAFIVAGRRGLLSVW